MEENKKTRQESTEIRSQLFNAMYYFLYFKSISKIFLTLHGIASITYRKLSCGHGSELTGGRSQFKKDTSSIARSPSPLALLVPWNERYQYEGFGPENKK